MYKKHYHLDNSHSYSYHICMHLVFIDAPYVDIAMTEWKHISAFSFVASIVDYHTVSFIGFILGNSTETLLMIYLVITRQIKKS